MKVLLDQAKVGLSRLLISSADKPAHLFEVVIRMPNGMRYYHPRDFIGGADARQQAYALIEQIKQDASININHWIPDPAFLKPIGERL